MGLTWVELGDGYLYVAGSAKVERPRLGVSVLYAPMFVRQPADK